MTGIGTLLTICLCCVCPWPVSTSDPVLTFSQDETGDGLPLPEKPLDVVASPGPSPAVPGPSIDPASLEYCHPHQTMHGQEGLVFPGYTLLQVHIVLSPGETVTPADTADLRHYLDPPRCDLPAGGVGRGKIASFTEAALLYKTMQHNKHAFKHFHPVIGPDCRADTLTARGYKQLISTGKHFFNSYFSDPQQTNLSAMADSIHTESVVERVSYQSLLAFLHGLLPEKQFASTSVGKTSDNLCSLRGSTTAPCHCPYIDPLAGPIDQVLHRGRYMFKDAFPYADNIRFLFGDVPGDRLSSVELYRLLVAGMCGGRGVECGGRSGCMNVTASNMALLAGLASSFLRRMAGDPTFRTFADLHTYPFLARLVATMAELHHPGTTHVYSGPPRFIPLLLTSLGLTVDTVLPISSRVVFELYGRAGDQTEAGNQYLRLLYNGEDVTGLAMPCVGRLQFGLCPLHRWQDLVTTRGHTFQGTCIQ